jgi:transposase-like protein
MSVMEEKLAGTRRSFSEEFKRDAVAMVLDDDNKIVDVARRLGVGEGTLGNWVRQERIDRGERAGLTTSEKAELAELRKGERSAADGTRPAQTSDGLLGEGVGTVTRYRWVAARKAEGFPIPPRARWPRSKRRRSMTDADAGRPGPTDAECAEAALVAAIREIHDETDGTYGERA